MLCNYFCNVFLIGCFTPKLGIVGAKHDKCCPELDDLFWNDDHKYL